MTSSFIVRLDENTKDQFQKLSYAEGKNSSQVIRELIEDYIRTRDITSYIDDLWGRMAKKFKSRRISSATIHRTIRQVRSHS